MIVTQAVFGVFHHFELGRELDRRGHLGRIYSTFPWQRLKREGLPHARVETFPWLHTTEILLGQRGLMNPWFQDAIGWAGALAFDEWTLRRIIPCDAFIGISGSGLKTGALVQKRGGKFICDRGSSHQRYQDVVVTEEHKLWGVEERGADPRDIGREEEIYATCDAITVPSSFARRSFLEMGLPAEKVHTIPYGVRLERFSKVAEPPTDRFEVLFVGSVSLRKGIPYLLQAFARVKHPNKRLRIVGPAAAFMKPVLERLPQDNVEFLGALPQTELPAIMSSSHVLALASIEEGLALVQGQALACGLPVLATTATGGEDLFTDEVEGFIVPTRDVEALHDRMQRLADDPALQQRMSEAALQRVKHIGGWSQYGDAWEKFLHTITGK